jgi:hypothetical protein
MINPATAEVWQTAFSQDFSGMAQVCDKTGQKGTNAMFVMTHKEIAHALQNGRKFTYTNPVVNYWPPKEHPNRICITASDNILYNFELSVRTADINMAKLHWNSAVSTKDAEYSASILNFFTCLLPLSISNTCASCWTCSQVGQSTSAICTSMPTKALCSKASQISN